MTVLSGADLRSCPRTHLLDGIEIAPPTEFRLRTLGAGAIHLLHSQLLGFAALLEHEHLLVQDFAVRFGQPMLHVFNVDRHWLPLRKIGRSRKQHRARAPLGIVYLERWSPSQRAIVVAKGLALRLRESESKKTTLGDTSNPSPINVWISFLREALIPSYFGISFLLKDTDCSIS